MRAFLFINLLVLTSGELTNWASHGELMDEVQLAQPALLSDEAVQAHNDDKTQTWVAGRNTIFQGATLKDAKVLMGTLQNTDMASFLPPQMSEAKMDVPDEFDWRTDPRAANCASVKEIRDQANCGSCWAFGSVEAMTDRICIASNASQNIHLSAEDVTSCDHLGDMGCNGGIPSTVYTYYRTFGIVDGGNYGDKSLCYSYQLEPCAHHTTSKKYANCTGEVKTPACTRKCENGKAWEASKHRGAGGYSVCQQGNGACADAMKQEIYQNGPITGMFFVHQSFLSYKSGVYSSKLVDPMLGGHAIKIMGYGTENGVDYWLVANSWNSDWGDNGFFKIKRGVNMDNIENPVINGGPVAGKPKLSDDLEVGTNPTHYGNPKTGCESDEQAVQVQGVSGDFCSPKCKSQVCPTDVPSGVTAKPTCALQTPTGAAYCALICTPSELRSNGANGECGSAACQAIQGTGLCTYPSSKASTVLVMQEQTQLMI